MSATRIVGRTLVGCAFFSALITIGAGGGLDRPVGPATPSVSARVSERFTQNKIDKIDLLFMIDNSSSMADKQQVLAHAIPDLVDRLVHPTCMDKDGRSTGTKPDGNGQCPPPSQRD